MTEAIACSKCSKPLPWQAFNTPDLQFCPGCGAGTLAAVFPAWTRAQSVGQAGERVLTEGESSCFYHPDKKAVIACESCGRFLCALCEIDLSGKRLCAGCIETGKRKGRMRHMRTHRMLYDEAALALALLPLLIWPFTIITAPATLVFVARFWKSPGSIIPRSKFRYVLAVLVALTQLTLWAVFVTAAIVS